MKVAGSYILDGTRECIWPLIYDPASLITFIPGCEQLEQVSPDEYRGQVRIRLPAVGGAYTTYVNLVEREEPNYCCFAGEVNGAAGSVRGTASFRLKAMEARTLLEYEGQALIAGPLARLDSRFVEGVAQTLIKQGLSRLNQQVQLKQATLPAIP
jgi:carbon monoxide dehydrogenase subunit G